MSTRFRPLTPEGESNKDDEILIDLERFEAELAISIARLGGGLPPDPRDVKDTEPLSRFPSLDQPLGDTPAVAAPSLPKASAAVSPAAAPPAPPRLPVSQASAATTTTAAPASGLDLLSELRLAAEVKIAANNDAETEKKERAARTNHAMRMLFRYFGEFSGHLDKIQPALPQTFRPLPNIELSGLHWTESFIDYRTDGGTEISPLDSISLRYKLSAGNSVLIEKLSAHAPAFLEEVKRVGLSYTTTEIRGTRGLVEQVNFSVARAISVSLLFKAHPEREIIDVQARNFNGLGSTHYTLQVSDIDQPLLDDFGKHILGRPSQLFSRLRKG